MTTPAAAALYLAQHNFEHEGRGNAVYNPKGLPVAELPFIYGFNNGGSSGWYSAQLISQDGHWLGSHTCSEEGYMPADLGVLESHGAKVPGNTRFWRRCVAFALFYTAWHFDPSNSELQNIDTSAFRNEPELADWRG
jgi:hypothetical protein